MRVLILVMMNVLFSSSVTAMDVPISKAEVNSYFENLLEKFNNEDVAGYEDIFLIPHARHLGNVVTFIDDESAPLVNFAKLKESGWSQSVMRSFDLLYSSSSKAFVNVHWTRLGANKEVIQNFTAFYALSKTKDGLKITYISSTSAPLSIGVKERN